MIMPKLMIMHTVEERAVTSTDTTEASSELQLARQAVANVIPVPYTAGETVYAPHEQLYLHIKDMEPAQVCYHRNAFLKR